MARLPRISLPGIPLHLIQRGNNHQACFGSDEDFAAYARWLGECAEKFSVAIHAWVFMTITSICCLLRRPRKASLA